MLLTIFNINEMIYSIQSYNNDYSVMKANIHIPWECKYVKYYVSAINTKANILVSTNDDKIVFIDNEDEECITINFADQYNITIADIIKLFKNAKVAIKYDDAKRVFTLETTSSISLTSITHRAALLLGLYNVKTPLHFKPGDTYFCPDAPILDYGNKFYLISLQGAAVYTNNNYTPSIIASIDTFIKDSMPMIVNFECLSKPLKLKINVDGLKYLEMQLVDFMFKPIIIKSPIFATLKIKPCNDTPTIDNI